MPFKKGYQPTAEHTARRNAAMRTEEFRIKLGVARRLNWQNPVYRERALSGFKTMDRKKPETIKKRVATRMLTDNYAHSDESKLKMSLAKRKRPYEHYLRKLFGRKQREVTLSYTDLLRIVESGVCHYCHVSIPWSIVAPRSGSATYMDRMDNTNGYTPENTVACCWRCNNGKGAAFTYDEWYAMTVVFRAIHPSALYAT